MDAYLVQARSRSSRVQVRVKVQAVSSSCQATPATCTVQRKTDRRRPSSTYETWLWQRLERRMRHANPSTVQHMDRIEGMLSKVNTRFRFRSVKVGLT